MAKQKIIIVGAGIGGLGVAIQLAQKGRDVRIFEKTSGSGGRCQRIVKNGHIFDSGPTMYLYPELYSQFFDLIGENINKYLKLIRTDPTYTLNFTDGTSLVLTSNSERMKSQMEKMEKGSYGKLLKYLEKAENHYSITTDRIITKSLDHPFRYFNLKNAFLLFQSKALANHYLFVSKYFKNPYLKAAFTFQDSYLGLNPFESPAIFSQFMFTEHKHGSYLPKGGMHEVIRALEKISRKNNVDIRFNSPVKKINIKNNLASGVTLDDGTIVGADKIVVDADLTYAYTNLLPDDPHVPKLLHKKYSCSAIIFHWGTDKLYSQFTTHNLFFSDSYSESFDKIINQKEPPAHPHFYIQSPSRTDSSRAPKSQDTLSVMIPINHLYPDQKVNWKEYRDSVRKYIIERLEKYGMKDIRKHIKFEISILPQDWKNNFNLTNGSIYGLHHNLGQLGYFREKRQHRKYKNVFFVGASTHPCSGLPSVLASSRFTVEKINGQ